MTGSKEDSYIVFLYLFSHKSVQLLQYATYLLLVIFQQNYGLQETHIKKKIQWKGHSAVENHNSRLDLLMPWQNCKLGEATQTFKIALIYAHIRILTGVVDFVHRCGNSHSGRELHGDLFPGRGDWN